MNYGLILTLPPFNQPPVPLQAFYSTFYVWFPFQWRRLKFDVFREAKPLSSATQLSKSPNSASMMSRCEAWPPRLQHRLTVGCKDTGWINSSPKGNFKVYHCSRALPYQELISHSVHVWRHRRNDWYIGIWWSLSTQLSGEQCHRASKKGKRHLWDVSGLTEYLKSENSPDFVIRINSEYLVEQ